jgi:hypothetical protein
MLSTLDTAMAMRRKYQNLTTYTKKLYEMLTYLKPRGNDSDYKWSDVLLATLYYVHKHITS